MMKNKRRRRRNANTAWARLENTGTLSKDNVPAWLKMLKTTNGLVSLSVRWCQKVGCSTSTEFFPNNRSLDGTSSESRPRAWRYLCKQSAQATRSRWGGLTLQQSVLVLGNGSWAGFGGCSCTIGWGRALSCSHRAVATKT